MHDLKSRQGDWLVDEAILPGEADHKNFHLAELVKEMKAQGLWLVVAGMDNPAKLDPEYLKSYLFALKGQKGKESVRAPPPRP